MTKFTAQTGMTKFAGAAPYIAKVQMDPKGAKFEAVAAHSRKTPVITKRSQSRQESVEVSSKSK
jgi:hypothetical protein